MTIADDLRAAVNWLYGDEHDDLCKRLLAHADTIEQVEGEMLDQLAGLNKYAVADWRDALLGGSNGN
jgi:hypothetical protein